MNPPRILVYHGEDLPAFELARRARIPQSTLLSRIDRLGWSVERAVDTPVDRRFRKGGRRPAGTPRACPVPRRDPSTGKSFVRWKSMGKRRSKWFGPWGSVQAKAAYAKFAANWAEHHGKPPAKPDDRTCIAELCVQFDEHAAKRYTKSGRLTSEYHVYHAACRTLLELFGALPTDQFRPDLFRKLREKWIANGLSRETVNEYARKVVRVFGYGAAHDLAPARVVEYLREVEPIAPGMTAAPEPVKVRSVDADVVARTIAALKDDARRPVLTAMIRTQLLTGMRPGELCAMTVESIDRTRTPWVYDTGAANKNYHREKPRRIFIGPEARAILQPLLNQPGHVFRFKDGPVRRSWYTILLKRACVAAGVEVWTANRLRHTRATAVMGRYESDRDVAAALGNTPEVARQVYVDDPGEAVAMRIAEATG